MPRLISLSTVHLNSGECNNIFIKGFSASWLIIGFTFTFNSFTLSYSESMCFEWDFFRTLKNADPSTLWICHHICLLVDWVIIGSGNCLWLTCSVLNHHLNQWYLIVSWKFKNKPQGDIQESEKRFIFTKLHFKMSSTKSYFIESLICFPIHHWPKLKGRELGTHYEYSISLLIKCPR